MGRTKNYFLWAALALAASIPGAQADPAVLTLSQLPAAVRDAVKTEAGDNAIGEITGSSEDGSVVYDVQINHDGKERTSSFGDSGNLISREVSMAELPPSLRRAIHAHAGKGGRILSVDKEMDGDDVTYEIDMKRNGRERTFTLDAHGKLLEMEQLLSEVPDAVRQTIVKKAAGGTIDSISKETEEGDVEYEAQITRAGRSRTLTVSPEGDFISLQMYLDELPAAGGRALQAEAAGGKIGEIDESIDDGEVSYTADVSERGKSCNVTVWNNGDREVELALADAPPAVQASLKQELKNGAKLQSFSRTVQDGDTAYEAETAADGAVRTLDFDPDGSLTYQEEPIGLAEAPEAVQKKLTAAAGKIIQLTKCDDDGDITYDAKVADGGQTTNMTFSPSGESVPAE